MGLQYIASNIKGDHTVGILDQALNYDTKAPTSDNGVWLYGMSKDLLVRLINDFAPDVVGISCNFSYQHLLLKQIAKIIKGINPKIQVIIGGNHVTAYYQKDFPPLECVDAYILGEAEEAFNLYLEGKLENKFYQVKDLDSLNFPSRCNMQPYYDTNLQHHQINTPGNRVVVMITSRGCYMNCIFCSVRNIWGKGVRLRSAENVLAEIDEIVNVHKATEIHFEDDSLLYDKQRCLKIFKGMEKYNIRWTCPNGVDISRIDAEILEAMRDSGCSRITICPESVTDRILKFYRKPFNFARIEKAVKLIRQYDFELVGYFIIGAPDETKEEAWETLVYALNNFDDSSVSCLAPYPGTDLYDYCVKNNLIEDNLLENNFQNLQADVIESFKRENITPKEMKDLLEAYTYLKAYKKQEVENGVV